jgi:tetratricopeptide (TPR) repeat protein
MRPPGLAALLVVLALIAGACAPTGETVQPSAAVSKEALYERGRLLSLQRQYDSAAAVLARSASMDSTYGAPVAALGALSYDLAMREPDNGSAARTENFRRARAYYRRAEALGVRDADVYDRLCEIAVALDDNVSFLTYARKSVALFPYDRQYYNFGLALFNAGEYQNTVKNQKEAAEKFKESPYLGGFYRQTGRAYMKLGRDQTAERVLEGGVKAVDLRIAALRSSGGDMKLSTRRLADDKIAMLLLLKKLHQTYKAVDKLERVERQLKEAGYAK